MLVKDLQQFLSKFTEADATGSRQGNAVSNAVIVMVEQGWIFYMKLKEWKFMNILFLSLVMVRSHSP